MFAVQQQVAERDYRGAPIDSASFAKIIEEVLPDEGYADGDGLKHCLWVLTRDEMDAGLCFLLVEHEANMAEAERASAPMTALGLAPAEVRMRIRSGSDGAAAGRRSRFRRSIAAVGA